MGAARVGSATAASPARTARTSSSTGRLSGEVTPAEVTRAPSVVDPGYARATMTETPAAPPSYDLVVLGSGPAGLAAAWRAARRGLSVAVLERAG